MKILHDFQIIDMDRFFSDGHAFILIEFRNKSNMKPKSPNAATININPGLKQANYQSFIDNISQESVNRIRDTIQSYGPDVEKESITNIVGQICDLLHTSASAAQGKTPNPSEHNSSSKPWFGRECKRARTKYHLAKKMHKRANSDSSKINLVEASKSYKKVMNKYINDYNRKHQNKLRQMQTKDPKAYWKYINSLKGKTSEDMPSVNAFFEHFSEIYTHDSEGDSDFDISNVGLNCENESLNCDFTASEIERGVLKLKNSKSPGIDGIKNEYIKLAKAKMTPVYVSLFNLILRSGAIPEQWSIAKIKPIYKNKGDRNDPDNYRPISLISCLGKLFTSLLSDRLSAFLEDNEILYNNQAGFRKNFSTNDHIFSLYAIIELLKFEKKKLFCSFVDFSKAFDSVWRVGLWRKLLQNDVKGDFVRIIYNMYDDIKSCISVNNESSGFFINNCGVRQGDNLSPVLFSVFLNDLEEHLMVDGVNGINIECSNNLITVYFQIYALLYADDTLILGDSAESFQKSLDSFYNYCAQWKMTINNSKTKVIIFGTRKHEKYSFKLGSSELEIVDSYKYLGAYFSRSRSFLNARKHIATQANKAMHLLSLRIRNLNLPIDLQLKLFDHTVLPILTYSCEVIGFESYKMLEPIHNQFLRSLFRARKSTPLYMLYGELGRLPLDITIKTRMISFWYTILAGTHCKFTFILYQKLISTPGLNSKWVAQIKQILQDCGRPDLWEQQAPTQSTTAMIKQCLVDQFYQNWSANPENSSKHRNYTIFKENIKLEEYFLKLPKFMYECLARFRTGNHRFPCETGRYQGVEYAERKCT